MNRLHLLLLAGVVALPLGCLALPDGGGMASKTSPSPPAAESVTLTTGASSSDQSAKVCLASAQTLEKKGSEKEALLEYEKARAKDPHLAGLAWRLAVLYDRQGDVVRARNEYQAALAEQPGNADLLNDIGCFYYQRRQNGDAENYLRQALAIEPNYKRAWVNLGKVLAEQARYEESCAAFGRVVRPAQAAANVGILLAKEGKIAEARQVLRRALELEPDLKAARTVLTQLDFVKPAEARLSVN